MPEAAAKAGAFEGALFASVLHARAGDARERTRTLWLVPLVIGLHALAAVGLGLAHGTRTAPPPESDKGELVLRLLAAPPPPPPAATAAPSQSIVARKTLARRHRPFPQPTVPKPRPVEPAPTPVEEALPAVADTAAVATAAPAGVAGGVEGGIVGGIVQRVIGAGSAGLLPVAPAPPTAEERADWESRYFEEMFKDRFEDVRYPHQGAMAGIEGKLVLRITVGAHGQLLGLGVEGPCPHFVLCDAAKEAVRKAAPFPPPPPRLGGRVTVYLPFNYHLR